MRSIVRIIVLLILAMAMAGCQKVLFPRDASITQYDTYDRMRRGHIPLEEPDVFGNPQPALRARLSQPR